MDDLGNRMKDYESKGETSLFTNLPIIARMDGRAFHSFTRGLDRPYDERLSSLMQETTKYLVEDTGAILGYTQSDEISLLFYNTSPDSQIFFNGRSTKLISNLAAMTTAFFNMNLGLYLMDKVDEFLTKDETDNKGTRSTNFAIFDARVFNVPNEVEASNYFIWRELDATKNSISMAAQSMFSHRELHGKNSSDKQEMMWQKGVNWNNYPEFFKRGCYFKRVKNSRKFTTEEINKLPRNHNAHNNPNLEVIRSEVVRLTLPPLLKIPDKVKLFFGDYIG